MKFYGFIAAALVGGVGTASAGMDQPQSTMHATGGVAANAATVAFHWKNQGMLDALAEMRRIHTGMRYSKDDSDEFIRDARSGANNDSRARE